MKRSFLEYLKESMENKKLDDLISRAVQSVSGIDELVGESGYIGCLNENQSINENSPFDISDQEVEFGETGEELDEEEYEQTYGKTLGNDLVTESETTDILTGRKTQTPRTSKDVREMAAQYKMVKDESNPNGYRLQRKASRYSTERHELSDEEINGILDQLHKQSVIADFSFEDGVLMRNGKKLNVRSKKKWVSKLNEIYKKAFPNTQNVFIFEILGKDDDGKYIVGDKLVKNLTPLKHSKDDENIIDLESAKYGPLSHEDEEIVKRILIKVGSVIRKNNLAYGYDFDKKCFTYNEQPITDPKMFNKLVLRLNNNVRQADDDKWNHFTFAKEGSKIGKHVGSFSLPPVHSCMDKVPCASQGCYAIKLYALRPLVAAGWDNNLALLQEGDKYDQFVSECVDFIKSKKLTHFRFQVSGDVFSEEYRNAIFDVVTKCGNVSFWLYTKNYKMFEGVSKPDNLVVILSAWGEFQPDENMIKKFPVAFLYDEKDPNIKKYCPTIEKKDGDGGLKICPCTQNNAQHVTCESCKICFTRKAENNLAFRKH